MDTSIFVICFISATIGSLLILLTTYFGNKYGSISGIITTIPSNTLVSLLAISYLNTDDIENLKINILASLLNTIILWLFIVIFWIYLPIKYYKNRKINQFNKIVINFIISIVFWSICTIPLIYYIIPIYIFPFISSYNR